MLLIASIKRKQFGRGLLLFAPLNFFLFFVGRNSLNFAPGVVQNCLQVGRNSSGTSRQVCQMSKIPPTYFWTSDAIWVCPISAVRRVVRCPKLLPTYFWTSDTIWTHSGHPTPPSAAQGMRPARSTSAGRSDTLGDFCL